MKTGVRLVGSFGVAATLLLLTPVAWAQQPPPGDPIDWQYAQTLHQKEQQGAPITDEEKACLDKAKAAIAAGRGPGRNAGARSEAGRAAQNSPTPLGNVPPATPSTGLIPLNEMTAQDTYKGEDGGLYGGGKNDPPEPHARAALAASARVKPLDADGKPSANGKIVLLSVGMSNTANEFGRFMRSAQDDPQRNPNVVVVNGALGGMTANCWATSDSRVWPEVENRLKAAGVTAKQVQAIWMKHACGGPFHLGEFPGHAQRLKEFLVQDINQTLLHYPNVRIIYASSRIYGGYATSALNPEPYAYESAFAVRWVIQDQIKGVSDLNCDPSKGEVKTPVLLWGPYLWADGTTPRKSDGLVYRQDDLGPDGTHPSPTGQEKVVKLLTDFFKTDQTAKSWYLKPNVKP